MGLHVECLPDETLVKKLGFTRKQVEHHDGKSRVFAALKKHQNQVALVDEDPGSSTTSYEDNLTTRESAFGITVKIDTKGHNRILILKVKLEDWIIAACSNSKIQISEFGLPSRPNELHDLINYRLPAFERLIDELLKRDNPNLLKLSEWLAK